MSAPSASGLLHRHSTGPQPRYRLVCFPHAGASPGFFAPWGRFLPEQVELVSARFCEPGGNQPESLHAFAEAAAAELDRLPKRRTVLFGHSMGAIAAYETALRVRRSRTARLVVSGSPTPGEHRSDDAHLLDDEGLAAELVRLGGTDGGLFDDHESRASWLPQIRHDYQLVNTHEPSAQQLDCPITAVVGDTDPEAPLDGVRRWRELTTAGFDVKVFAGGHFYLLERQAEVLAEVRRHLGPRASAESAMP